MSGAKKLKVGGRFIGDQEPCFVIAEIGSNHNQDLDLAFRMIDAAARSGVDAVKFQTFRADSHYSKFTPGFSYLDNTDTHSLIKSLELDRSWQGKLKQHAEEHELVFFSSPCDSDAIAGLAALDVDLYKVASFDMTDQRLVGELAATGKPLIMSTGMATWSDIQFALDAAMGRGNDQLVLLQCTSLYPAPANLSNLRAMATMRQAFDVLVGYSDHTLGDHVALAAVALGACVIERHFTTDRSLPGPDHVFAIEPDEMSEMMKRLRDIEAAMGDGLKNGPRAEEMEMAQKGRRSLHALVDIPAGTVIDSSMLTIKRPGLGIRPSLEAEVVGRTARRDIIADQWITWDML
ncbi:N-acetylneuraminate synthase family protein [Devosia ginsengisoli]|uniref:N-acetylneuraminate synthase family protein n=1 Tax=Devosia ginsengisoli TaxID=400770 RepID=UPI0026EDE9D4|nr:N-acetylneuraminate synthase family protein [Devosia ginsengisoli]MCR6672051.1 N-acetylneuraminate synthase family protein [Devosia ginsengisoli]